jgi:hypothetical protein
MRPPTGDPYSTERVDDALEVLHVHAELLCNEGDIGEGVILSKALRLLGHLRNVRREEKPAVPRETSRLRL